MTLLFPSLTHVFQSRSDNAPQLLLKWLIPCQLYRQQETAAIHSTQRTFVGGFSCTHVGLASVPKGRLGLLFNARLALPQHSNLKAMYLQKGKIKVNQWHSSLVHYMLYTMNNSSSLRFITFSLYGAPLLSRY